MKKYVTIILVLVVNLFVFGNSYVDTSSTFLSLTAPSHSATLGGGKVEAYVTHVCSESSTNGAIKSVISMGSAPYQIRYSKNRQPRIPTTP